VHQVERGVRHGEAFDVGELLEVGQVLDDEALLARAAQQGRELAR
jgi:hypothetical protein